LLQRVGIIGGSKGKHERQVVKGDPLTSRDQKGGEGKGSPVKNIPGLFLVKPAPNCQDWASEGGEGMAGGKGKRGKLWLDTVLLSKKARDETSPEKVIKKTASSTRGKGKKPRARPSNLGDGEREI